MARTPKADPMPTPARQVHRPRPIEEARAADAPAAASGTAAALPGADRPAVSSPASGARGRTPRPQPDAAATVAPDPGEGAAAEASPAADGPPPDDTEGDTLIAEMAFPASGGGA